MENMPPAERRRSKRFKMEHPVVVIVRKQKRSAEEVRRGRLRDISDQGAAFHSCGPFEIGTKVVLRVSFPNKSGSVSTIEYDGLVVRTQPEPPHETAALFCGRGRIYSNDRQARAKNEAPAVSPCRVDASTVDPLSNARLDSRFRRLLAVDSRKAMVDRHR